MTDPLQPSPPSNEQSVSPGPRLAAARQQLGMSVPEAAARLNLASRQIEAMEAEDWQALPGMAVARGFVRSYAKLVKIDPAPLMGQMQAHPAGKVETIVPQRNLPESDFSTDRQPPMGVQGERKRPGLPLVVLALVVLIAAVAVWQYVAMQGSDQAASVPIEAGSPASATTTLDSGTATTVLPPPLMSAPSETPPGVAGAAPGPAPVPAPSPAQGPAGQSGQIGQSGVSPGPIAAPTPLAPSVPAPTPAVPAAPTR